MAVAARPPKSQADSEKPAELEQDDADPAREVAPLVPGKVGDSMQMFDKLGAGAGLGILAHHFGYKLLVMLFASQHLMKGFAAAFTDPCTQYLYASYKVAGPQLQIYGGVTGLPWAMKPVIGLVSDIFPLGGYNKTPYIFISCIFGIMACFTVASVPQDHMGVKRLVMCLFMMQLMFSTADLLTEAKYAEKMRAKPEHGPALMTFVWFGINVGSLLATALVGPIIAHYGFKLPFMLALIPICFILFPLVRNYMDETPRTADEVSEMRHELLEKQGEACFLCFLMFIGTVVLTGLGITYQSPAVNATGAIIVAVVMLLSFSIVLRPEIAKVNAFFLLQTMLGFSIGGGAFYFYIDDAVAYPEGPHFSREFYTSVLGVVGALCSLLGIFTYQKYASDWSYRSLLLVTNVVMSVLSLSDVVMFTRLNVRVGIPDHAWVIGGSVFSQVIAQWMWMPGIVIMSQLCPPGMEATMYALLAGCHNLGNTISGSTGALLLQWLGCQPKGEANETEQFKNLWLASLMSTIAPMFTLILLPLLIPDAKQTDKIFADDDRDATKGSLLRRWRGR